MTMYSAVINPVLPTVVCAMPYCCRLFAMNKLNPHSAPPIKVDLFHPMRVLPFFLSTSIFIKMNMPIVATASENLNPLNVKVGTSEAADCCATKAKPQTSAHNEQNKIPVKL